MQKKSLNKKQKNIFLVLLIGILLVTGAYAAYYFMQKNHVTRIINNFETCAAAGNPILESYPEQCVAPDGRSFTKQY